MARLGRPGLTDGQRHELWERWKAGDSISDIGRAMCKHLGSIHGVLALGGGIYRSERKRTPGALTALERGETVHIFEKSDPGTERVWCNAHSEMPTLLCGKCRRLHPLGVRQSGSSVFAISDIGKNMRVLMPQEMLEPRCRSISHDTPSPRTVMASCWLRR